MSDTLVARSRHLYVERHCNEPDPKPDWPLYDFLSINEDEGEGHVNTIVIEHPSDALVIADALLAWAREAK